MDDFDVIERRHRGLVFGIADRYYAPGLGRDDLIQEATIGLWKACRDYDPRLGGAFAGFAALCIERQVITAVQTATRGKHSPLNTAMDLDGTAAHDGDGAVLRDALPAPGAAAHDVAERRQDVRDLQAAMTRLTDTERDAVLFIANGGSYQGNKSIDNALQRSRKKLAAGPAPDSTAERGVLLVDRTVHPTERDAIRACGRVRPGCKVLELHKRKVRDGRVVDARGRAKADGSLGRPVWAVEIQAA